MNSLRVQLVVAVAAVSSFVASSVTADDGVVLRYKSTKGGKQYVSSKMELDMKQNIAGMDLKTTFSSDIVTEVEALDPTDKGEIVVRYKSLQYKMKADFPIIGKYDYDSKSTDNDKSGQISALLTPVNDAASGAVVDVTYSNRGTVSTVSGIQDAMKAVVEQNAGAAQFTGGAQTDEGAKLSFEEQFVAFPEKAVKEGDTWEKPFTMALPQVGKFEGKTTYKYEGIEKVEGRDLHKITFTNDLSIDVNQKADGANVTGTLKITASSGTALFDAEKGIIVSLETSATVSGNLNIEVGGMNIPLQQEQTQKSSTKVLDGPPK